MVSFLVDRKKVLKDKLREIYQQIDNYNQLISKEQTGREIKNELKKSILQKRSQIEELRQTLQRAKQEKQQQVAKVKQL